MQLNPNHLRLGEALSGYRRAFFIVFMFSLIINVLVLAGPLYMLQVFDRVLTSQSTDTLLMLSVIGVVALLTMSILDGVRNRITVTLSAWLDRMLSPSLFEGAVYSALKNDTPASTQSLRDIRTLRSFIASPQLLAFFDAPWAPFFVFIIFLLHPYLGVVALGGAVVLFAIALLNEKLTRGPASEDGGATIVAMSLADATVRNADSVSAMGMLPAIRARWEESTAKARANQIVSERRGSTLVTMSKFVRMVLQMMILGMGAWLAVSGEITPGVMIAGSILMGRALSPVEQAIGGWRTMIGARNSYNRVREQLLTQPIVPASMELPAPMGKLSVSGVSYMLEGHREPVLRNVSFLAEPGECLALVGPSGSGKSTLARLLLGNISPKTGHVRLDGMDVSSWSPDQLGPYCGYLPQDIELFAGTVKENIARMAEPVAEHVVSAAQIAGCHELILSLPEGYETRISDRGSSLSGGTRQRIGLARALYGNPKLVVLDEPNSNLDAQGEAALAGALTALKTTITTVVIIGHRQSTLQHADKVVMLKDGTVQAAGTRDEVAEQLGLAKPKTAATDPLPNKVAVNAGSPAKPKTQLTKVDINLPLDAGTQTLTKIVKKTDANASNEQAANANTNVDTKTGLNLKLASNSDAVPDNAKKPKTANTKQSHQKR